MREYSGFPRSAQPVQQRRRVRKGPDHSNDLAAPPHRQLPVPA